MKRIAVLVFGSLIMMVAGVAPIAACSCSDFVVEGASKAAASIFIGEVVHVGEPREVVIGSTTAKLYVTRFFVYERWKGPKSVEAEVLTELPAHYGLDQMNVGDIYLIYARPVTVPQGPTTIEGIVTSCSRGSFIGRSGSEQVFTATAFHDVFELDRIFNPRNPRRTSMFWRAQQPTKLCLVCCLMGD